MAKRGNRISIMLYFFLVSLLLLFLILHSFSLAEINTDFFTRFLLGMLFILLVLPLVPYVKIFDIVEVRRKARMFKANRKK
ncbi:hypothetical protein HYY72_02915 [Candidatus Woesearchaeota archaeon]|nr:hypothetical protein [Candidatus Woesearchaeota archaeon]